MKNKKGFTLIELIVVIAILGILALFLVPSFIGYADDAQKATCDANRHLIERSYKFYKVRNEDVLLSAYINGDGSEYQGSQCPSKGTYSYDDDNGKVLCSIHGEADDEISDSDIPSDEPEETKDKIPGTDLDVNQNIITIKNGGKLNYGLDKGTIIKIDKDGTIDYYIVKTRIGNGNPISVSNKDLIKITDEKATVVNGNSESALNNALGNNRSIGVKVKYNDKYYISIENIDKNEPQLPGTGDHWLEIK